VSRRNRPTGRRLRRQKRHDGAYWFSRFCGPGLRIWLRNRREAAYWREHDTYWLLTGLLYEELP
jgi:hypothetical protein